METTEIYINLFKPITVHFIGMLCIYPAKASRMHLLPRVKQEKKDFKLATFYLMQDTSTTINISMSTTYEGIVCWRVRKNYCITRTDNYRGLQAQIRKVNLLSFARAPTAAEALSHYYQATHIVVINHRSYYRSNVVHGDQVGVEGQTIIGIYSNWMKVYGQSPSKVRNVFGPYSNVCGDPRCRLRMVR